MRTLLFLPLMFLFSSCAHYEYDVLDPKLPLSHIGTADDLVFEQAPVSYHFKTEDNRLVVRIFNITPDRLDLVGIKSAVVDPTGQTRPLKSQPLPSGAFIKLILPPVRPEFVASGTPAYAGPGIGRREFGFADDDAPQTYVLRDNGEVYWEWQGESHIRLLLTFKRGDKEIAQEFTLGRKPAE